MKIADPTNALRISEIRRFTPPLIAAAALLLLGACGNTNPSSATPSTGQNEPLTWNTTTWDNSDWT
jgi:ABC-type glycerol-3-phosphate transport system substrate-binding protein